MQFSYFIHRKCFSADVFQSPTSTLQKDESIVRVLVRIPNQQVFNEVCLTTTVP